MSKPVKITVARSGEVKVKPKYKPRGRSFTKGNTVGFKKGNDPNRNLRGRPPYRGFAEMFVEQLATPAPKDIVAALNLQRGATKHDAVIAAALRNAMHGDNQALALVQELIEGRQVQTLHPRSRARGPYT